MKRSNTNRFRVEAKEGEIFKTVPALPNYEVSNFGRVRKVAVQVGNHFRKPFMLKQNRRYVGNQDVADNALSKGNYVMLRDNGYVYTVAVALLVYQTFVGEVDRSKFLVAFHNDTPTDARLENIYLKPRSAKSAALDKLHRLRAAVQEQ